MTKKSEPQDAAREPSIEEQAFAFLSRYYVQRADARQREMGLQYTEAETHDLAKQMAKFAAQAVAAERVAQHEREIDLVSGARGEGRSEGWAACEDKFTTLLPELLEVIG